MNQERKAVEEAIFHTMSMKRTHCKFSITQINEAYGSLTSLENCVHVIKSSVPDVAFLLLSRNKDGTAISSICHVPDTTKQTSPRDFTERVFEKFIKDLKISEDGTTVELLPIEKGDECGILEKGHLYISELNSKV